ncbi:glycosyltransferase family 2 protein [Ferirhizobium litorale]|uniref:Glycosyltransferase family 2 protein n=1 Tax=Ferirhizobium litorale TaxID=2927786 RepID=A0AAE3QB88_9HYPH|nr:glycosyltransferase family A protein [Fererhizobium litorale]MDI7921835.1 glycosyltransferase family 2 protein [Fererhizobium litorale]
MFSLIVCSVNRFDQLERLFGSLTRQTCREFEVILVDQNPDDRLVPVVARFANDYTIRHIRSAKGLSRARNRGMAEAKGAFVAFPDDDCWYRPDTLETVRKLFAGHPQLSGVTGRTLDADGIVSVSPTGEAPVTIARANYLLCGNSNGTFLRAESLRAIGGFDERLGVGAETIFQSGEEADLLLRAMDLGQQLMFFPEIIVHHDQVDSAITDAQIERARKYGRGFGALLNKHGFGAAYTGYRLLRPFGGMLVAFLRRDGLKARYKWAWTLGILEGYRSWGRQAEQG